MLLFRFILLGFVFFFVISCVKKDPELETFDHASPTIYDIEKAGVSNLNLNGKAYIYFSKLIYINFSTDFWLYNSTNNLFTPKTDFPGNDRVSMHLVPFNQSIFGGLSKIQTVPKHNDWFMYDTLGNQWNAKLPCPYPLPNAIEGTKSGTGNILFSCPYAIFGNAICPVIYNVNSNTWSRNTSNCDSLAVSCF